MTFLPDKQYGKINYYNMEKLIIIVPPSLTLLKATNAEFSFTEVLFTDQNNRQLEIEDNMNIFLIIGTG